MTQVKVDLALLQKYFSEYYDTENPTLYFPKTVYELENSLNNRHKPIYCCIHKFCIEYNIPEYTDLFFNLHTISWVVTFRKEHIDPTTGDIRDAVQYKKELFTLYLNTIKQMVGHNLDEGDQKSKKIKCYTLDSISINATEGKIAKASFKNGILDFSYSNVPTEPFKITDDILLRQFRTFILDTTSDLFYKKRWDELTPQENGMINNSVKEWMKKKRSGAPNKMYFIGQLLTSIRKFVFSELGESFFKSKRELNYFMGSLLIVFQMLPQTDKDTLIKTVENYLRAFEKSA